MSDYNIYSNSSSGDDKGKAPEQYIATEAVINSNENVDENISETEEKDNTVKTADYTQPFTASDNNQPVVPDPYSIYTQTENKVQDSSEASCNTYTGQSTYSASNNNYTGQSNSSTSNNSYSGQSNSSSNNSYSGQSNSSSNNSYSGQSSFPPSNNGYSGQNNFSAPYNSYSGQNNYSAPYNSYSGQSNFSTPYNSYSGQNNSTQNNNYAGQNNSTQNNNYAGQNSYFTGSNCNGQNYYETQNSSNNGQNCYSETNNGYSYNQAGYLPSSYNNQRQYQYYSYNPYTGAPANPAPRKKTANSKVVKFFKLAGSAIAFGLFSGIIFLGTNHVYYLINPDAKPQQQAEQQFDMTTNNKLNLNPVNDENKQLPSTNIVDNVKIESTDVSAIVDNAIPSIVSITATFNTNAYFGLAQSSGVGSGIIMQKNDTELLIATNSHVVNGAVSVQVNFCDDTSAAATIKGTDSLADLAVVAIKLSDLSEDTLKAIATAKIGSSDNIKVGQMVVAIGDALGYGQSTTVGYVSAKDRLVKVDNKDMTLLQTDAAINPGNSGGALLNIEGEVIGINSVKYASSEVEGMGFAIPISRATAILDELMSRETLDENEKGYLGVYIEDVTADISFAYNWPIGIRVTNFTKYSAAEAAGIKPGDIITMINGLSVATSKELKETITSYKYGTVVKITVQRLVSGSFEPYEYDVTLNRDPIFIDAEESNDKQTSEDGVTPSDGAKNPIDETMPSNDTESSDGDGKAQLPEGGIKDPADTKLPEDGIKDPADTKLPEDEIKDPADTQIPEGHITLPDGSALPDDWFVFPDGLLP